MNDPRHGEAPGSEVPGDTGAADIVAPTGEEMPVADHDDVDAPRRVPEPAPAPRRGITVPTKGNRLPR